MAKKIKNHPLMNGLGVALVKNCIIVGTPVFVAFLFNSLTELRTVNATLIEKIEAIEMRLADHSKEEQHYRDISYSRLNKVESRSVANETSIKYIEKDE